MNKLNKIKFLGVGWKSKVLFKRATFYLSINKLVADGCCIEKGEELFSYLAEDEKGRKIIVTYLDSGKSFNPKKQNQDFPGCKEPRTRFAVFNQGSLHGKRKEKIKRKKR